jgi:hypothetical protein
MELNGLYENAVRVHSFILAINGSGLVATSLKSRLTKLFLFHPPAFASELLEPPLLLPGV